MYTIKPHLLAGGSSPSQAYDRNVKALQTLKSLTGPATEADKDVMSRYKGWGSTPTVKLAFPKGGYIWSPTSPEIEALHLSDDEKKTLLASQLNAHYTSCDVISAIYKALGDAGMDDWESIRLLEPSAGVGNFIGSIPPTLAAKTQATAVEIDILTGQLLQAIYPEINTLIMGYEEAPLPKGFFDLVISNVPFGDYPVIDGSVKKKLRRSIHDYFFVKALSHLKPGGILAFVTSRYTLDKMDTYVREYLASQAELLAAVRLPGNAFLENAGTQVITDIIILRKGAATRPQTWVTTDLIEVNGLGIRLNNHFINHPEHILGELTTGRGMYGNGEMLVKGSGNLSDQIYQQLTAQLPKLEAAAETTVNETVTIATPETSASMGDSPIAVALFDLYTTAKQYITAQQLLDDSKTTDKLRQKLNELYDTFRLQYGAINKLPSRNLNKTSPIFLFVRGLEKRIGSEWTKTDIFFENTITPHSQPQINSASDALQWSLTEKARVDLDFIAALRGTDTQTVLDELTGLIFQTLDGKILDRSEYLSGNVRAKLKEAKIAAAIDPKFAINVEALTSALPTELKPGEIIARLGGTWIDPQFVADFIAFLVPSARDTKVHYNRALNKWDISNIDWHGRSSIEATSEWGTGRMDAFGLIERALNSQTPVVYDRIDDKSVINEKETLLAQAKLTDIQTKFRSWLWEDEKRAATAAHTYNETINCFVRRQFDGSHLQFPGSNKNITLRPSQKSGIARILSNQTALIGHLVGAGKTFIAVAATMEGKRIGLIKKALLIVPNHLTEQAGAMARSLYPGINVLVADKEDTSSENRGALLTRIATNNFDLVILSHTAFMSLPFKPETLEAYMDEDLDELQNALAEVEGSKNPEDRISAKEIQKRIKRFEEKLDAVRNIKRDSVHTITWEDLGIDALFVDESDLFKNLEFQTNMTRIAGINSNGSLRAQDLKYKTRWLLENNRKTIFLTGTPISNTLGEAWVCQMYLQPELMKSLNLHHFDNWAASFAESTTGLEMKPDGSGYRMHTRFNKFINVPEMMAIWNNTLDLKTIEELELPAAQIPFPGPQIVESEADEALKNYVRELGKRADDIRSGRVDPKVDNMLVITSDGRKSALHMALVDHTYQGRSPKVEKLCHKVKQVWEEFSSDRATQIIFIDLATPKGKKTDDTADPETMTTQEILAQNGIYGIIKAELVRQGIPSHEIAFIHDAKTNPAKLKLFQAMNAGKVRVLLASTEKAGAGTNVQERLVAIHHVTTPWRPRDLDQRNGRLITAFSGDKVYPRPGNLLVEKNVPLNLYYHITKGSVDGFVWQLIESKQKFISAILRGTCQAREVDDVDQAVLTASQIKAAASGNPLIIEHVEMQAEMDRLIRIYDSWITNRSRNADRLEYLPEQIKQQEKHLHAVQATIAATHTNEHFIIELNGKTIEERVDAGKAILETAYSAWMDAKLKGRPIKQQLGSYRGLNLWIEAYARQAHFSATDIELYFQYGNFKKEFALSDGYTGTIQSLDYHINNLSSHAATTAANIAHNKQQLEKAQAEINKPFAQAGRYQEVSKRLIALNHLLMQSDDTDVAAQAYEMFIPELLQEVRNETSPPPVIHTITMIHPPLQPIRPARRKTAYVNIHQPSFFELFDAQM